MLSGKHVRSTVHYKKWSAMKIIDITGTMYTNMWTYGPPFPNFEIKEAETPEWLENKVYGEVFNGMFSQTGTYLETPAHFLGYEKSYPLIDVDVAALVDIDAYVIKLDLDDLPVSGGRPSITKEALVSNFDQNIYQKEKCRSIIVSTGWGKNWRKS